MHVSRAILRENRGEIVTGVILLSALWFMSLYSFLLFHSLIELFTVVVGTGIFVIAWNARSYLNNNYLLFVGISSLFVALLDLLHTLAYEGMGVFRDASGNLATQLWIAGRAFQSASFVAASAFLNRGLRIHLTIAGFMAATLLAIMAIFHWHIFPTMYVEGEGLTATKKGAEYLISLLLLAAIGFLVMKRQEFDPAVLRLLAAALTLFIASEITFTFYSSVYGEANVVGHMLRLVGAYALYKAIIQTALERPYALLLRDLKRSQEKLEEYATALEARNDALSRSEERLQEETALLRERNVELDAYAHTVAHDLKNPLAVIIAASEMLGDTGHLTAEQRSGPLDEMRSTALHMDEILDNLLALSQVRRSSVPAEPVVMEKVVANVRSRLGVMMQRRNAQLTTPDAWPTAIGYAPWIEEVWANYVSNAIKYGGCPPLVELGADAMPTGKVRFWVRDNGPGVDPSLLPLLFAPLERLGRPESQGHGLGLSIVHHIVKKLGGEVGVESRPGKGSLFFFVLPAAGGVSHGADQGINEPRAFSG